ncbi:MAG TPA: cytochrome c3 family protein [Candidatus Methylomirabilis sp.]|nr:cytochrome c3 family protein [Candidatus Methylomirabilis sp.]
MRPRNRADILRNLRRALAGVAMVLAASAGVVWALGGVYTQTKHGNATSGVSRIQGLPVGSCEQCHVYHGGGSPNAFALFTPNTNALCATAGCHGAPAVNGIYQGPTTFTASSHATSTGMVWPGPDATVDSGAPPARLSGDAGKCVNCHTPHGYKDATGLIPSMVFSREEKSCIVCHDGSPASKNVKADFARTYRHTAGTAAGRHNEAEGGTPAKYGATPIDNRHAECVDCHNPHIAKTDAGAITAPSASNRLLGVGRVAVINGTAGTIPTYTYRGPADPSPVLEYEVCFKCHSSWTTLPLTTPSGGTPQDKALQFNPNNRSYHPVEAAGKNINIMPAAFVNNWNATKTMYCTDCHTTDASGVRGPHGSTYNYILKKDYRASSSNRTMSSSEICFDCHLYDTYANNNASNTVKAYSRFNPPAFSRGHTYHVGSRQRPCYACHESHASTALPHLIVTGRNPGMRSFTETASGGSCSPTCHGNESYSSINYPR